MSQKYPPFFKVIEGDQTLQNQYEVFDVIQIEVRTSECQGSGTDMLVLMHLGLLDPTTGKLVHVSGPYLIESFGARLEPNTVDSAVQKKMKLQYPFTYDDTMSTVRCLAAKPAKVEMCLPGADVVFIEKRNFSPNINEPVSHWKPAAIRVAVTFIDSKGSHIDRRFSHELPSACDRGWIDTIGYYKIGPLETSFQKLSPIKPLEMVIGYENHIPQTAAANPQADQQQQVATGEQLHAPAPALGVHQHPQLRPQTTRLTNLQEEMMPP